MSVMTPPRSQTEVLNDFKQILGRHGVPTEKLDDQQWASIFEEVNPLFTNTIEDTHTEYVRSP